MSSGIQSTPYAIGYIDSGHGHDDGLVEIKLRNLDGNFVDSLSVGDAGVMAAASQTTMPAAAGDWETVNLINQPGPTTWPIVAVSYTLRSTGAGRPFRAVGSGGIHCLKKSIVLRGWGALPAA